MTWSKLILLHKTFKAPYNRYCATTRDKVSCRNACTLFYSALNYPKNTLQIVMYDPEMGNVIHFGEKLIGTQKLSVCDLKTDR